MPSTHNVDEKFLHLVKAIFEAEGYTVTALDGSSTVKPPQSSQLRIQSVTGAASIVEVKLYRSREAPVDALRQTAENLYFAMGYHEGASGIIVVGSNVSSPIVVEFEREFPDLTIYDIDNLANLVGPHHDLARRLDSLLREVLAFSDFRQPEPEEPRPTKPPRKTHLKRTPPRKIGADLCAEINAIPLGKLGAKKFETKAAEALEYTFSGDLAGWSRQQGTNTRSSIYDLTARIASSQDFWKSMVHHFQSRYVVFELKNYGLRIKQGQIYTTEKYLYRAALRAIAVIVSRKGADTNALAAARGALREHGKLIINLTVDDLCKMLHLKDSGGDHNSVLVDIVDEMLLKIER